MTRYCVFIVTVIIFNIALAAKYLTLRESVTNCKMYMEFDQWIECCNNEWVKWDVKSVLMMGDRTFFVYSQISYSFKPLSYCNIPFSKIKNKSPKETLKKIEIAWLSVPLYQQKYLYEIFRGQLCDASIRFQLRKTKYLFNTSSVREFPHVETSLIISFVLRDKNWQLFYNFLMLSIYFFHKVFGLIMKARNLYLKMIFNVLSRLLNPLG